MLLSWLRLQLFELLLAALFLPVRRWLGKSATKATNKPEKLTMMKLFGHAHVLKAWQKPTYCNIVLEITIKLKNRNIFWVKYGTTHLETSWKITSDKINQCVFSVIPISGQRKKLLEILFSVKIPQVSQKICLKNLYFLKFLKITATDAVQDILI